MAIRRQQNWLGQERVDVADLRAIESGVTNDFDVLAGRVLAGRQALIVRGFTISTANTSGNPADQLQLSVASGLLLHQNGSEAGTLFFVDDNASAEVLASTNAKVQGAFTASSTNYVGIDLRRTEDSATSDLKQFLDANTKLEIPKTVPTARTMGFKIIISTQPFSVASNVCPIAKVVTNGSNSVVSITDARQMMFRLGSGGDSPNAGSQYAWASRSENAITFNPPTTTDDPFTGADKSITSMKQWMDAMMSRLWELGGGEHWYSTTARDNVKVVYNPPSVGSDNWSYNSGTSTLSWNEIQLAFENSTVYFNDIADGSAVLSSNGQCLYVDIDRTQSASALVPVVGSLLSLGLSSTPGARFILAWRLNDVIHVRDRAYELGRVSEVPATTTTLGSVVLNQTPADALLPSVVTIMADGRIQVTATANNTTAATFTGFGTGAGGAFVGGGTGTGGYGSTHQGGGTNGAGINTTGGGTGAGILATGGPSGGPGGIFNSTGDRYGIESYSTGTLAAVRAHATGSTAILAEASGATADTTSRFALEAVAGHIKLSGGNPSNNIGFTNIVTPANIAKAWCTLDLNAGVYTFSGPSFNIDTGTAISMVGNMFFVSLKNGFPAAGDYIVVPSDANGGGTTRTLWGYENQNGTQFGIRGLTITAAGAIAAVTGATVCKVSIVIYGKQ